MKVNFEEATYQAIEDLKLLQAYTSASEPTVQVQSITDLTSKTKFGNWLAWAYMDNREHLPADKWTQLLEIAMNLVLFFATNFISGNRIFAPKWWKIGFWAKVGKVAFEAVRDIIKIFRNG